MAQSWWDMAFSSAAKRGDEGLGKVCQTEDIKGSETSRKVTFSLILAAMNLSSRSGQRE